ncbi:MAG: hypothetical protein ACREU3_08250 [Steroidobacteraceae bacterium]
MRSVRELANRVRSRVRPSAVPAEDQRVLVLFKNRAELKKAYGELQDEVHRLKDRIKQQEGATARVQEMLAALETRLGLAETAFSALVFYQLRALWQSGRAILEQFVAELASQQEDHERRAFLADCNRRLFARRQVVDAALRAAESRQAEALDRCAALSAQRARLERFWHYFRRRDLDRRLGPAREEAREAAEALAAARRAFDELDAEPAPVFPGLSLEARRAINIAAIAYAQILCRRLIDTPLVALAREATARREVADNYGDRAECEALIASIARARTLLAARPSAAQEVKTRAQALKPLARYRNRSDTTPVPESAGLGERDVLNGEPLGPKRAARVPNVLAEDTWDLFRVLLR